MDTRGLTWRVRSSRPGDAAHVAANVRDRVVEDLDDVLVVVGPRAGLLRVELIVVGGAERLAVELHGRRLAGVDDAVLVGVLVPVRIGGAVVGAVAGARRRCGAVGRGRAVRLDGGVQAGGDQRDLLLRLGVRGAVPVVFGAEGGRDRVDAERADVALPHA